jgi:hypothetical protein
MIRLIKKFNSWMRSLLLDDVDKEPDGLPSYHKKFGSKRNPVDRIENRFSQQKKQNRG